MGGFLFDRDFDAEIEAERQVQLSDPAQDPVAAAAARARETALQEAEARGHAAGLTEGHAAGRAEALAEIAAQEAACLQALLPAIDGLRQDLTRHRQQRERDLAQMCLDLAERLWPELSRHYRASRIEAFCRTAMRIAEGQSGIDLFVPADLAAAIEAKLQEGRAHAATTLHLSADPALAPTQARATWAGGGAEFATDRIAQQLLTTLHQLAQGPAPTGKGQPQ